MAAPDGRTRAPQPSPEADAQPRHATPVAATIAGVALGLQRSAGNRATGRLLGRAPLARDPVKTEPKPPIPPKSTQKLAVAIATGDVAAITGTPLKLAQIEGRLAQILAQIDPRSRAGGAPIRAART